MPYRTSRPCHVLVALALTSLPWATASADAPPAPWEGEPFTAAPGEMLRAADAVPFAGEHDAAVLLSDHHYSFDTEGRLTYRLHYVYRLLAHEAHESWKEIEMAWAPWHQERPTIRARVITPDGEEHPLDPATLHEGAVPSDAPAHYQDRSRLTAPLPAVGKGAIVEEEIVLRDREPVFGGGTVARKFLVQRMPVRHVRLVVETPAETPLRWVVRELPGVTPREALASGRRRLEIEARDLPAVEKAEDGVPPDAFERGFVVFSTGRAWSEVASLYSQVVDEALAGADLAAMVAEAGETASRRELIDRLLALVRREIRYTSLALGSASVIPRPPAETLRRKYGDCKDQAVLLTGLLRAAGIPASVALVNVYFGHGAEPDLPGFGTFDHAIVVVPGDQPLWVDPTDPYARAGELPEADQGRLALIADPASTGLVRTPEAAAADNRQSDEYEVLLADYGEGSLRLEQRRTGALESAMRGFLSRAEAATHREFFQSILRAIVAVEDLDSFESSPPPDLTQPLSVRLTSSKIGGAVTDDTSAVVAVPWGAVLHNLPRVLIAPEAEPRRSDYVFEMPFQHRATYRVVPPRGFTPRPLPASRTRSLGTATLSEEYAAEPDGTVRATLLFDSGKHRLTAAEFDALRAAVVELDNSEPLALWFDQVGEAHLAAGRVREALAEFRRLVAAAPDRALPRMRLARALLAGGMGLAAREEAESAAALEPDSSRAQAVLGWVRQHDPLGRRFGPGSDREAALAALRKASRLDPKDAVARLDLAILLEHDAQGRRYAHPADLDAAIAEYRAVREEIEEHAFDDNLLIAMMRAGRFAEILEILPQMDGAGNPALFRLVAVAGANGAAAATVEADRVFADAATREQALIEAAATLVQCRRYAEAAGLFAHAAKGSSDAASLLAAAGVLRGVRRYEEIELPADRPTSVVRRLRIAGAAGVVPEAEYRELFSAELVRRDQVPPRRAPVLPSEVAQLFGDLELPAAALADLALAGPPEAVEGDDATGYRIRLPGAAPALVAFVVRESGGYRIVGTNHDSMPGLGLEALRRLAAGDVAGGRRWLDRARAELTRSNGDEPLPIPPFSGIWTRGGEAGDERVRCAAAALAAPFDAEALGPVLEACREAAAEQAERDAYDLALAMANVFQERFAAAIAPVRRLRAAHPQSALAYGLESGALEMLKRWDELRGAAEAWLRRFPDDLTAERGLHSSAMYTGDLAGSRSRIERLIAGGRAEATEYNNLAWVALFEGRVGPAEIEQAQRSASLTGFADRAVLHTLATVYAEAGQTAEAYQVLLQSLAGSDGEPTSHDWYVIGRLAEHYGLPEVAREYYARVEPEEGNAVATHLLAQRRVKALSRAAP